MSEVRMRFRWVRSPVARCEEPNQRGKYLNPRPANLKLELWQLQQRLRQVHLIKHYCQHLLAKSCSLLSPRVINKESELCWPLEHSVLLNARAQKRVYKQTFALLTYFCNFHIYFASITVYCYTQNSTVSVLCCTVSVSDTRVFLKCLLYVKML